MTEQKTVNIEDVWITRSERYGTRFIIGVQNQMPQSFEDEQRLFATLKDRTNEIPEQEYEVFRFEEKHIGAFWQYLCSQENQEKYGLDIVKARYEIFNDALQPHGITEIYYPKR